MLEKDKFIISKKDFEKEKINHLIFLAKKDFIIDIPFNYFSKDALLHLKKLGHWYSALQNGEIKPITQWQKKFVNHLKGNYEGIGQIGITWIYYNEKVKKWGDLHNILNKSSKEEINTLKLILNCNSDKTDDILNKIIGYSQNLLEFLADTSYNDILKKVKNKLKLEGDYLSNKDYERAISVKVFEDALSKMNEEQKKKFEEEIIKIAKTEKGIDYKAGTLLATLTAANLSGFGVYLLATTTLSTLSGIIGLTLPFAAYTTLTSAISFFTGPAGWVGLGVFTLWKISDVNYNKLIPAIIYIHWLREKYETKIV